jgi:hypothetical protein
MTATRIILALAALGTGAGCAVRPPTLPPGQTAVTDLAAAAGPWTVPLSAEARGPWSQLDRCFGDAPLNAYAPGSATLAIQPDPGGARLAYDGPDGAWSEILPVEIRDGQVVLGPVRDWGGLPPLLWVWTSERWWLRRRDADGALVVHRDGGSAFFLVLPLLGARLNEGPAVWPPRDPGNATTRP